MRPRRWLPAPCARSSSVSAEARWNNFSSAWSMTRCSASASSSGLRKKSPSENNGTPAPSLGPFGVARRAGDAKPRPRKIRIGSACRLDTDHGEYAATDRAEPATARDSFASAAFGGTGCDLDLRWGAVAFARNAHDSVAGADRCDYISLRTGLLLNQARHRAEICSPAGE